MNLPIEVVQYLNTEVGSFNQTLENTSYPVWLVKQDDFALGKARSFLVNYSLTAYMGQDLWTSEKRSWGWCIVITAPISIEVTKILDKELNSTALESDYSPCLAWPVDCEPENLDDILTKVRSLLEAYPVLVYKSYTDWRDDPGFVGYDSITVAPTTNKFDILRFEKINGDNYGLGTEDIIRELIELDKKYGLDFIGPAELQLQRIPDKEEVIELKEWLFDFCPDVYNEYTDISGLSGGRIELWWD